MRSLSVCGYGVFLGVILTMFGLFVRPSWSDVEYANVVPLVLSRVRTKAISLGPVMEKNWKSLRVSLIELSRRWSSLNLHRPLCWRYFTFMLTSPFGFIPSHCFTSSFPRQVLSFSFVRLPFSPFTHTLAGRSAGRLAGLFLPQRQSRLSLYS